jgi:LCP family protein required for cell wall assembly
MNDKNVTSKTSRNTRKRTKVKTKHKASNSQHNYYSLAKIAAVVCLIAVVSFELTLIRLNVLPAKIMIAVLFVYTPVGILVFLGLFFNNVKKTLRIISAVLSALLIVTSLAGIGYVTGTINFLDKITSIGDVVTYETYNVIAPIESQVETIEDIELSDVGIYSINNENYTKAINELKEVVECEFVKVDDLETLGNDLLDGEYECILLSEVNYEALEESADGYMEKTKVIYTIDIENIQKDTAVRVGVTEEPFNIFISGIDMYGDINKVSRSDVNMIVTVNPKTNKILLTSIPRDSYVTLPTYGVKDKLTHAGVYGVNESISAVEELMGIEINYYVKANFTAVENLVDAINGIEVDSDYAFTTKKGRYKITKGMNHLDGKEALSFARERYAFSDGDFQRIIDQQKVIEAIIKKISSSSTILMNYNDILGAAEGNMDTNMATDDLKALVKMQIDDMPSWEVEKSSLHEGSDAMLTGYSYPNQALYMFVLNEDAVIEAADKINAVMSEE